MAMDPGDRKALFHFCVRILGLDRARAETLRGHLETAASPTEFFQKALQAGDISGHDVASLTDWYRVRDHYRDGDLSTKVLERADAMLAESMEILSRYEEAPRPLLVGKTPERIGPYRILNEIGRGGMGIVFRAIDPGMDREVALKVLKGGESIDATRLARFEREIELCGTLQHPSIVQIHSSDREGEFVWYAMEYVEGKPLDKWLKENSLEPVRRIEMLLPVVDALAYAHDRGIIHRDVKPANVLVDREGRPRIGDFGLAKSLFAHDKLTQTGAMIGTPVYMSPEQADRRPDKVGPHSDVYGLGVLFYEVLAGAPPFTADSLFELMLQILSKEPESLRKRNPLIPKDLDRIVLQCLAKDPADRYPTARELLEDLQRFLHGVEVLARPRGISSSAMTQIRRHRRVALWTAGLGVLFLAAGAWAGYEFLVADRADEDDSRPGGDDATRERKARDALASGARRLDVRDAEGAIPAFEAALSAAPGDRLRAEAHAGLARARLALGELDRAMEDARRAVELAPGWTPAILVRGRVLAQLERHREAVADLRRAAQEMRDDLEVHLDLAASALALVAGPDSSDDDARTVSAALVRAADLAPSGDARPHYLRGTLLLATGDAEGAKKSYDRALTADPNHGPSLAARARLALDPEERLSFLERAASLPEPPGGLAALFGAAYIELGKPREALAAIETSRFGPSRPGALHPDLDRLRAEAIWVLGDEPPAAPAVAPDPPPDPAPDSPEDRMASRLDRLCRTGYVERARFLGRLGALRFPEDGRLAAGLARAFDLGGNRDAAAAVYERALALRPLDETVLLAAAANELARGEHEACLALARRASARGAPGDRAALLAAQALGALARPQEALDALGEMKEEDLSERALDLRVELLEETGRAGESRELRERTLRDRGKRAAEARRWLDEGRSAQDSEPDRALAAFDRAIEIDPSLAEAYHNRAIFRKNLFARTGSQVLLATWRIDFCRAMRFNPGLADLVLYNPQQLTRLLDVRPVIVEIEKIMAEGDYDPAFYVARAFLTAVSVMIPGEEAVGLEETLADFELARRLDPGYTIARMLSGAVLRHMGRAAEAEEALLAAHRAAPEVAMIRYEIASLYASQKDAAKAVEYLDPIVARDRDLCRRIREDPSFDRVRESPEFRALLERRCK
ncbi:MAG: protein kinase [Planctomycetes bacterium]|nr:protein kinase [Planctomycetota bacterium]